MREIIDRSCQGSFEELLSGMVDVKVLSQGELKQLERLEQLVRGRQHRRK